MELANTCGLMAAFMKASLKMILSKLFFYHRHGKGEVQYPDGRIMAGLWTEGVLVEVLSKLNEAHK